MKLRKCLMCLPLTKGADWNWIDYVTRKNVNSEQQSRRTPRRTWYRVWREFAVGRHSPPRIGSLQFRKCFCHSLIYFIHKKTPFWGFICNAMWSSKLIRLKTVHPLCIWHKILDMTFKYSFHLSHWLMQYGWIGLIKYPVQHERITADVTWIAKWWKDGFRNVNKSSAWHKSLIRHGLL